MVTIASLAEVDMYTRRRAMLFSAALAVDLTSRPIWSSEKRQPPKSNPKATFIVSAMDEVKAEIIARSNEMAKHGEFASIAPPPALIPFGDWDFYYVKDFPLVWSPNPGQTYSKVSVPIGFVSDLTSVPQAFWSMLPPAGRYAYAAVIHDYLYWFQERPRSEADDILRIAMEDSKVAATTVTTIYNAVRLGGGVAWNDNKALRAKGEKRVLKKFPQDFTTSWSDWKKRGDVFAS